MQKVNRIFFHEQQSFSQGPVMYIVAIAFILSFGLIIYITAAGYIPLTEAIWPFVILAVLYGLIFYLLQVSVFETTISNTGISFRWHPFMRRQVFLDKEKIAEASMRKSPPLQYGFRLFPGYGKIFNFSGRDGVQIVLKNGKKYYLGTAEPFMLNKAIQSLFEDSKLSK